jgi:hypothetical protein
MLTLYNNPAFNNGTKDKIQFTLEQATKAQKGSTYIVYSFFNLGSRCGWVVNIATRLLYARERLGTHCTGGWVSCRTGVEGCGKSRPLPGFDPRTVSTELPRPTPLITDDLQRGSIHPCRFCTIYLSSLIHNKFQFKNDPPPGP